MEIACYAMICMICGIAFNCNRQGEGGCCEFVKESLLRYCGHMNHPNIQMTKIPPQEQGLRPPHEGVLKAVCTAITSLAAGNLKNQAKFDGMKPILQAIHMNHEFSEQTRKEAKVAFSLLK